MYTPPHRRTLIVASMLLCASTLFSGCSKSTPPSETAKAQDGQPDTPSAQRSTPDIYPGILGVIKALPIAGDPTSDLKIRHQQVPTFKSKDGTVHVNAKGVAGMGSMSMPFPLAKGVSVDGFVVGDQVMFTLEVNWNGPNGMSFQVTQISKIDPGTKIDFTNAIETLKESVKDAGDDAMDTMNEHMDHDMGSKGP